VKEQPDRLEGVDDRIGKAAIEVVDEDDDRGDVVPEFAHKTIELLAKLRNGLDRFRFRLGSDGSLGTAPATSPAAAATGGGAWAAVAAAAAAIGATRTKPMVRASRFRRSPTRC
jgi:hypothetical protein